MAKSRQLNRLNLSYFFGVSFLALFSLFVFLIAPLYSETTLLPKRIEQLPVEKGEVEERGCLLPTMPQNVKATTGSNPGQINLSWSPASRATNYNIIYGPASLNYLWGIPGVGNVTSYIISDLIPGEDYYFIVAAVNDCGCLMNLYEAAAFANSEEQKGEPWPSAEVVEYIPPPLATPSAMATPSAEATTEASPVVLPSPSSEQPLGKIVFPDWLKWAALATLVLFILAFIGKKLVGKEIKPPSEPPPTGSEPEPIPPEPMVETEAPPLSEGEPPNL